MASPRLVLACILFVSADSAFLEKIAKRSGLPDPHCKTGVISLTKPQSCCAGYCGECSDYPTCESVRGQASKNACCASAVYDMRCGNGKDPNVCLKPCSESEPPCIMDKELATFKPTVHKRNAAENCTTAVEKWRKMADSAVKAGEKGALAGTWEKTDEKKWCENRIVVGSGTFDECKDIVLNDDRCETVTYSNSQNDKCFCVPKGETCKKASADFTDVYVYKTR